MEPKKKHFKSGGYSTYGFPRMVPFALMKGGGAFFKN